AGWTGGPSLANGVRYDTPRRVDITATGGINTDYNSQINVKPGPTDRLQLIVSPGTEETERPGCVAGPGCGGQGKSGSVVTKTVNTGFSVRVNRTDQFWNRKAYTGDVDNGNIGADTTDPYDSDPSDNIALSGGKLDFTVTPKQYTTSFKITAYPASGNIANSTSPPMAVNAGSAVRLHIVMDCGDGCGEKLEQGFGVSGTPAMATAGKPIGLKVYVTDSNYNLVNTVSTAAVLVESFYASGGAEFNVKGTTKAIDAGVASWVPEVDGPIIFTARPDAKIKATLVDPITLSPLSGAYSADTESSVFVATTAAFNKLIVRFSNDQTLKPGQWDNQTNPNDTDSWFACASPYTLCGKSIGTQPGSKSVGNSYPVEIIATDRYYNSVSTNPQVLLLPSGAPNIFNEIIEGQPIQTLQNGSTIYNMLFKVADNATGRYWTAIHISSAVASTRSPNVIVNPQTSPKKIVLLLPGECLAPGSALGKLGSPDEDGMADESVEGCLTGKGNGVQNFIAGKAIRYKIRLTDDYFNPKSDVDTTIQLTSLDPNDTGDDPKSVVVSGNSFYPENPEANNEWWSFKTASGPAPSGGWTLTAQRASGGCADCSLDNSAKLTVDSDFNCVTGQCQLLLQLTPQTFTPGVGLGGSAATKGAGTQFQATVRAVDPSYNMLNSGANSAPQVTFDVLEAAGAAQESDPNDLLPAGFSAGQAVQDFILYYATNTARLFVDNVGGYDFASFTTPALTISASDYYRLHVILPGETYQPARKDSETGCGTDFDCGTGGKSGSPNPRTAGVPFNIDVRAEDRFYNQVSTDTSITVVTDDLYDTSAYGPQTLSGGYRQLALTLKTSTETAPSPNRAIARCTNLSLCAGYGIVYGTSAHIPVNSSNAVALLAIAPNQVYVPGDTSNSGISGTAQSEQVGSSFTVTVRLVDSYYNRVPVPSPVPLLRVRGEDPYATIPADVSLSTGEYAFNNFYFKKANASPGWRIFATTAPGSAVTNIAWSTSPFIVAPATTTSRLLVILPNETHDPGNESNNGKYGTASHAASGSNYRVTVLATDRFYNIQSATDTAVFVDTPDPYDVHPATVALSGGTTTFDVVFRTATSDPDVPRGPWFVRSATATSSILQEYQTGSVIVDAGQAVKLLVVSPGTSHEPGSSLGYTGTVSTQSAGSNFTVTVKVVDQYNNRNLTAPANIGLASNDPHDETRLLQAQSTTEGKAQFTGALLRTVNRAGDSLPAYSPQGWVISASTTAGTLYTPGFCAPVPTTGGQATRLMVLMPGEALDEGNVTTGGKNLANPPSTLRAGTTYTAIINATDDSYNVDTTTSVE
ncbi:MAG: hypothetical protein AAB091_02180, partial [Elusimicrobiota bacterium]